MGLSHPPSGQVCHAAAGGRSLGSEPQELQACVPGSRSAPTPKGARQGQGRVWRQGPGRGSEASVRAAPTPGVRPPADRRARAGRPLGAARTGRDGTRAAPPHLSPAAFRGAPPRAAEEGPPKAGEAPPHAGRRRRMQVREKGAPRWSHHPPGSLIKHFLPGSEAEGVLQGKNARAWFSPLSSCPPAKALSHPGNAPLSLDRTG